jgi:hypothetical protein
MIFLVGRLICAKKKTPAVPGGFRKQRYTILANGCTVFGKGFEAASRPRPEDGSAYARHYLSGLLRMKGERHFAGIGREAGVDGQNIQHFMSESPWSGEAVCRQVQDELKARPELLSGGVLLVDESADEKAGDKVAGAGKQYHGRMGKVETSQVGVLLSYVNLKVAQGLWTWPEGRRSCPKGGLRRLTRRCGSVWASRSRGFSKPRWNWPGN